MAEEAKPKDASDASQEPKLPELTIRVNPNGSVTVHGPINDKILAYGMLEAARDAIFEHSMRQIASIIKPNGGGMLSRLRGGR